MTIATTFELPADVARAAELALERKAVELVTLDLRGVSSATDFFFKLALKISEYLKWLGISHGCINQMDIIPNVSVSNNQIRPSIMVIIHEYS